MQEIHFTGSKSYMITVELHEISKANRVSEDIEIVDIATEFPAYGQQRAANELRKRGILREICVGNFKKRLLKQELCKTV